MRSSGLSLIANALWTGSPVWHDPAASPHGVSSTNSTGHCTVQFHQAAEKHWGTKILWAKKEIIICPVERNIFTVLNKEKIDDKWSEKPLRSTQKDQKGAEGQ